MNRIQVNSRSIASVGYDESSETLEVVFNHGGTYHYFDVPRQVLQELLTASSIGRFVALQITRRYRYTLVE